MMRGGTLKSAGQRDTFRFGTIRFSLIRRCDLKPLISDWAAGPAQSVTMTLTGAHGIHESRRNPAVQRAHDDADYVLCDGTPPWLGAVVGGHRDAVDRIPGRDAMREIAASGAALGLQQVFAGGPPGLAERTAAGLQTAIDAPIDAVAWSPPFTEAMDATYVELVAERLRSARTPAIVWIGLSTPKQELLMQLLRQRLPTGYFFAAVGAAFDMYAGTRPPPPRIVSGLGMEWLYRSMQEPRRLPARYARALPGVVSALAAAARDRILRR